MFALGFIEEVRQFVNPVDDQNDPVIFVLFVFVVLFGLDKGKPGFFMMLLAVFIEVVYENMEILQILSQ